MKTKRGARQDWGRFITFFQPGYGCLFIDERAPWILSFVFQRRGYGLEMFEGRGRAPLKNKRVGVWVTRSINRQLLA
jgi:hypothetical protein